MLKTAGYCTMMVGKWHAEGNPFERGFDRHFGFIEGGTDFYVTSALTEHAIKFIREENVNHRERPFFLYLAYNAPHSPIRAPEDLVKKYRGACTRSWDAIRHERFKSQQEIGLVDSAWHFSKRPANIPAWDSLTDENKDFEVLRMATYAAMADCHHPAPFRPGSRGPTYRYAGRDFRPTDVSGEVVNAIIA